jgi:hypothetical protein
MTYREVLRQSSLGDVVCVLAVVAALFWFVFLRPPPKLRHIGKGASLDLNSPNRTNVSPGAKQRAVIRKTEGGG